MEDCSKGTKRGNMDLLRKAGVLWDREVKAVGGKVIVLSRGKEPLFKYFSV